MAIMLLTEAPTTLRMPISFIRCSAVKIARPNKPKQEMKMARKEKIICEFIDHLLALI